MRFLALGMMFYSSSGQTESAMEAHENLLAGARSLASEPLLISGLVRIACVALSNTGLEHLVTHNALTEAQLHRLDEQLLQMEADGMQALKRALAGERAFVFSFF